MHEKRNFVMVLLLIGSIIWAIIAWLFLLPEQWMVQSQRTTSLLLMLSVGAWLFYAMKFEDKLPDHLRHVVGEFYYETDGLSFRPIIRARKGRAELCLYYQNRFENPVEAIIHFRLPAPPEECFVIQPGMRDIRFAFRVSGGTFGVIHQPIAVPRGLQGEIVEVQLAASSWYPRSKGLRLRRRPGMPCGTVLVDWIGNPLKVGVHEVCGEVPLINPVLVHLPMPNEVHEELVEAHLWRQELLAAGVEAHA